MREFLIEVLNNDHNISVQAELFRNGYDWFENRKEYLSFARHFASGESRAIHADETGRLMHSALDYYKGYPDTKYLPVITFDQIELKEYTIKILNEKHSKLVQQKLFDIGCEWITSGFEMQDYCGGYFTITSKKIWRDFHSDLPLKRLKEIR